MQTFVPLPGFVDSARVLDDRRLGKQRVETFQILRALTWPEYGWKNHPATKMWRGFTPALVCYGLACIEEWERRGRLDSTRAQLLEFTGGRVPVWEQLLDRGELPPWLGHSPVHISHQSALVRKAPEIYRPLFPEVPDDLPYLWPSPAFPRWPIRRGHSNAMPLVQALAMLGFEELRPWQRAAVDAVYEGNARTIEVAPGAGATSAGLLAALCTQGRTLWVTPGPPLPRTAGTPGERQPPQPASRTSPSIARPSSDAAALAMREEGAAEAEISFVRPETLAAAWSEDVGLVVIEGRTPVDPGHRVPVLRLVTQSAEPAESAESAEHRS